MRSSIESPWKDAAGRDVERGEKRAAVLRAAARAFCDKGVRNTSLDAIAMRLRITKPTLYHYFGSKDEILVECVMLGLRVIEDAIAEATAQRLGALERLRAALLRYAECMTMDFAMCVTRIDETELSPPGRRAFRSEKRKIDARIRGLIADCVDEGSIRTGDVTLMAFTVAGALNWIARWYDPAGSLAPAQIAGRVVDILMRGLVWREVGETGKGFHPLDPDQRLSL